MTVSPMKLGSSPIIIPSWIYQVLLIVMYTVAGIFILGLFILPICGLWLNAKSLLLLLHQPPCVARYIPTIIYELPLTTYKWFRYQLCKTSQSYSWYLNQFGKQVWRSGGLKLVQTMLQALSWPQLIIIISYCPTCGSKAACVNVAMTTCVCYNSFYHMQLECLLCESVLHNTASKLLD